MKNTNNAEFSLYQCGKPHCVVDGGAKAAGRWVTERSAAEDGAAAAAVSISVLLLRKRVARVFVIRWWRSRYIA